MAANAMSNPFPTFEDIDGDPLEAGYIYIGVAGLNAVTNPIQVYSDKALTVPVAQPIRTVGGYPQSGGAAIRMFVNVDDCSILVRNKNGTLIYSTLNQTEAVPASLVTFVQSGTGAVATTIQVKSRERVSLADFGGSPSASAAVNTAAFVNAKATGKAIWISSPGTYAINELTLDGGDILIAEDYGVVLSYAGAGVAISITNGGNRVEGVTIVTTAAAAAGIKINGSSNIISNCAVSGNPAKGIWLYSGDTTLQANWNLISNCTVNTAVLPLVFEAAGTGAVNSNTVSGPTNWRTSAAAGGVICYMNGGGNGCIGNNFYDGDFSNYGGAASKCFVLDGPATSQTGFFGISIDTDAGFTQGFVLGAGVSSTKIIGGTIQCTTPVVQNNTTTLSTDVIFISSQNFIRGITQETWVSPTLLNSWVNYGGGEATAQYFKDSNGIVHIKGTVKDGTFVAGTNIFVLPDGYRPLTNHMFAQNNAGVFGATSVASNGAVFVGAAASATYLSLDCSFRA